MADIFGDDFDDKAKSKEAGDFAKMFEASLGGLDKSLSVGDRINGEILSIGKDEFFVSTGTMNDGVVLKSELLDANGQFPHKVGDCLDLYVTKLKGSQVFLSTKPTAKNIAEDLEDAFDMMLPVEGRVTEAVNGGFRVSLQGQLAFCPISQIDNRFVEEPEKYIGKKFEFLITKFEAKNIVVSRRKLLEEQKQVSQAHFVDDHKPGDMVTGTVTRIEKYGAFIELTPGLEGLAHISELDWSRISDPSEVVQVGQTVNAKILKIEENGPKLNISLSVKQATPEPWERLPAQIAPGQLLQGRVERRERYGLFVKVEEGIVGLLPKSKTVEATEFSFDKVNIGDEISVRVLEVQPEQRRLTLGLPTDPEAESWRDYKESEGKGMGTLGEQFKDLFKKK